MEAKVRKYVCAVCVRCGRCMVWEEKGKQITLVGGNQQMALQQSRSVKIPGVGSTRWILDIVLLFSLPRNRYERQKTFIQKWRLTIKLTNKIKCRE